MRRRLSTWLVLSAVVHVGLAAVPLSALRVAAPRILFIDLVHDLWSNETPAASGQAGGRENVAPRTPSASRAERAAGAHAAPAWSASPSAALLARTVDAPPPTLAPDLSLSTRAGPTPPVHESPPPPTPRAVEAEPSPAATKVSPPGPVEEERSLIGAVAVDTPGAGGPGGSPVARGVAGDAPGSVDGQPGTGSTGGRGGFGVGAGSGRGLGIGGGTALAVPGDGGGDAAEYVAYLALLRRRIHESLTYPMAARRRGLTGTVHIELEIEPTGTIARVAVAVSSSHSLLDEAALAAVRGLGRVPFPANVRPRQLRVRLPVVFELR
jgi:TonB family protein